jgi:hypothetical protein
MFGEGQSKIRAQDDKIARGHHIKCRKRMEVSNWMVGMDGYYYVEGMLDFCHDLQTRETNCWESFLHNCGRVEGWNQLGAYHQRSDIRQTFPVMQIEKMRTSTF